MPISHELKLIFIHIPKTGGTTLEYHLGMHENLKKVGLETTITTKANNSLFGNESQHYTASDLKAILDMETFEKFEKFSVVRNPYTRFISEMSWQGGFKNWHTASYLPRDKFDELLNNIFCNYLKNKNILFEKNHLKPQYCYVYEKNNLIVDKIFKYENFLNIESYIQKFTNYTKLEKRMTSNHKSPDYYLDEGNSKKIYKMYEKDFLLFNYAKSRRVLS